MGNVTLSRQWSQTTAFPGDILTVTYTATVSKSQSQNLNMVLNTFDDNLAAYLSSSSLTSFDSWASVSPIPTATGNILQLNTGPSASQSYPGLTTGTKTFVFTVTIGNIAPQVVPGIAMTSQNISTSPTWFLEDTNTLTILALDCIAEESQLVLSTGLRYSIECLEAGSIVQSINNSFVSIDKVIRCGATCNFVQLTNKDERLLLTDDHPILIQGQKVLPSALVGNCNFATRVSIAKTNVYVLITEHPTFVKINGFLVATWGRAAWNEHKRHEASLLLE
jgi:hypothetical protein